MTEASISYLSGLTRFCPETFPSHLFPILKTKHILATVCSLHQMNHFPFACTCPYQVCSCDLTSRAMTGHNAPVFSHSARACHMLRIEIKFIFSQQYEYKCKYSYCSTYARSYQVCIFGRFSYKVQFARTCFPYVAYDKPQFI